MGDSRLWLHPNLQFLQLSFLLETSDELLAAALDKVDEGVVLAAEHEHAPAFPHRHGRTIGIVLLEKVDKRLGKVWRRNGQRAGRRWQVESSVREEGQSRRGADDWNSETDTRLWSVRMLPSVLVQCA